MDIVLTLVLTILPVPFHLFGPVPVSLPGIKRRIDSGSTTSGSRSFGDPPAVLLPAIRVRIVTGMYTSFTIIRRILFVGVVAEVSSPGCFLGVLHLNLPVNSFVEILRARGAGSQELHHRADRDFSHKNQ